MATPTYTLIDSVTLSTAVTNLTFSSLPQTYGDLVIVTSGTFSGASGIELQLNDDTSNYSMVSMGGNGSSTFSATDSSFRLAYYTISGQTTTIGNLMDYSATDKHTTMISRASPSGDVVSATASRWANTEAVTKIKIINAAGETFSVGHTFHIYGIAKAL
jgi:hypothetical protein